MPVSRPSRLVKALPCFLLLLSTCLGLKAQESADERKKDLQAAKKHIQSYVDAIRPKLFVNLTEAEAKIYQSISFRVTDNDHASSAVGAIEDGQRIIEIGEGYGRQIEMMAEALIIEGVQNRPVLVPYAKYVARQWNRNASFTKDPTAFAHFNVDDLDDSQIAAMAVNGIAFVLAHEVGHHVLHHYDHPMPKDPAALRQLEEDADSWALQQCVKGHVSPLGGMLPLLLDYYLSTSPITTEGRSDHPADVKRIKAMFEGMQNALPQYRADIEKQGQSYSDFSRYIKQQLHDFEDQIRNDSPPIEELGERRP
jgi:hypothetical protein